MCLMFVSTMFHIASRSCGVNSELLTMLTANLQSVDGGERLVFRWTLPDSREQTHLLSLRVTWQGYCS